MEMQQIRYFLALCEDRSFTRAAKRCGVAQPSLTRAIQQLEMELGGPLFERSRWSSQISRLGTIVRPHLAAVDRTAALAKREAAAFLAADQVLPFKQKENRMRKIIYGAAVVAGLLLVAVLVDRQPKQATALQFNAHDTVDVRALEATIDLKRLSPQDVPTEAYQ